MRHELRFQVKQMVEGLADLHEALDDLHTLASELALSADEKVEVLGWLQDIAYTVKEMTGEVKRSRTTQVAANVVRFPGSMGPDQEDGHITNRRERAAQAHVIPFHREQRASG